MGDQAIISCDADETQTINVTPYSVLHVPQDRKESRARGALRLDQAAHPRTVTVAFTCENQ